MGGNGGHAKVDVRKLVRTGYVRVPAVANLKAWVQYTACRTLHRPFEVEFRALEALLSPDDLCLDLGANRGQSIEALQMLSFPVRIIAFEPQSHLYRRLIKRFGSQLHITVLPFGASDRPAQTHIYVPYYNGYCFDGLASLRREGVDEWLRMSLYGFDERKVEVKALCCQTVRLDDLAMGPVAFIKLDVQGSEEAALLGLRETLPRDKPHLMIETPSPEVKCFLARLGYRQYNYTNGRLQRSDDWTLNPFFLQ